MFVEDDELIARIYSQKFSEEGFDVAVAVDGLEAIRLLPEFKPDLMVLDLLMPKFTGADVLKFLRRHPDLKDTFVVVFSNSFLSDLVEQVAALGVEKALVKSTVTPSQLVGVVREVLSGPGRSRPALEPATASPAAAVPQAAASVPPLLAQAGSSGATTAPVAQRKESDSEFRARIRREFYENAPLILKNVRQLCRDFVEAADTPAQPALLTALSRKTRLLTQMSAMAGCRQVAQASGALDALLFELQDKPDFVNDSTRHTIASAVALVVELLDRAGHTDEPPLLAPQVLVVDDNAVSNRALVLALGKAEINAESVNDPYVALQRLRENAYDLVLLDIEMPGIDGISLCEQLRGFPLHKQTPVIFVTSHTDFKTRARSILSGGDDLITKPILPVELGVKAVLHLVRKAWARSSAPPTAAAAAASDNRP